MMIDAMTGDGWTAFVVGTAVKGGLVLLLAALGTLSLRRSSAAARHLVWLLAMVALLVLPVASLSVPGWSVEMPARVRAEVGPSASEVAGVGVGRGERGVARSSRDDAGAASSARTRTSSPDAVGIGAGRIAAPASAAVAVGGPTPAVDGAEPTPADDARMPSTGPSGGPTGSLPLAAVLLVLWAGGAVALVTRLAVSHFALRRLAARARPLGSTRVTTMVGSLCERMGVKREVRLFEGGPGTMPMSWGLLRASILLPSGAEAWPTDRLASVLLHELAHVRRRDCLAQLVAEFAVALHWPNPMAWLAAHRLRVEREHACDDTVLVHGARATRYASELVALARELRTLPGSIPAGVAMLGPAHLKARIRAVLDADRPRMLGRRFALAGAATAAAVVGLLASVTPVEAVSEGGSASLGSREPLAMAMTTRPAESPQTRSSPVAVPDPATAERFSASVVSASEGATLSPLALSPLALPQNATCGMATSGWRRTSVQSNDDDRYRMEWSRPGCTVEIRMEGDVTFAGDFRGIERLARGAMLRIEEKDDGTERWLEVTPDASGRPAFEYRVDRDEHAFDAQARAWYEGMLLQVFRRTGLMARERVASMLREGGVQAVLDEMEMLPADHAFSRYVVELIEQADLTESQAVSLVDRARSRVESDHYMTEILLAVADRSLDSEAGMNAFLQAAGTLESDHYRAQVLGHALERRKLTDAQVTTLVDEVSSMESDHYVTQVLMAVAERYFLDDALRGTYLRAVSSVESDHYRTEILGALLSRGDLDAGELQAVLDAVSEMESAHYQTELLGRMNAEGMTSRELGAFLSIVAGMDSDHYQAQALRDAARSNRSEEDLVRVVETVRTIDSDHYKAELLTEIARAHQVSEGALRDALVEAMNTIESGHYRGRVAEALLRR